LNAARCTGWEGGIGERGTGFGVEPEGGEGEGGREGGEVDGDRATVLVVDEVFLAGDAGGNLSGGGRDQVVELLVTAIIGLGIDKVIHAAEFGMADTGEDAGFTSALHVDREDASEEETPGCAADFGGRAGLVPGVATGLFPNVFTADDGEVEEVGANPTLFTATVEVAIEDGAGRELAHGEVEPAGKGVVRMVVDREKRWDGQAAEIVL
jgi:hypothetical protein